MRKLLFLLPLYLAFAGCASIFTPDHAKVEFYAPRGAVAHYDDGNAIHIIEDSDKSFFYARGGDGEAVVFDYQGHIRRVELGKNLNALIFLDYFSDGIGLLIDDATNAWYTYQPFSVFQEPLSQYPDSESIPYRKGWFYDPHRPNLLLTAGWGIGTGVQIEWGVGIGYRHQIDLLYREITALGITIHPSLNDPFSGTALSKACVLRVYPLGGLFFEGGFGRVTMSADTIPNPATNVNFLAYPPWSTSFNEVLGGMGWAGDLSYIELQFYYGLSNYRYYDLSPTHLEGISVTYGLYLRL